MKLILICLLLVMINTDIPTHCLRTQIIGKWNFDLSKAIPKDLTELYKHTCGHKVPSHESTSHLITIDPKDYPNKSIQIDLHADNTAVWGLKVIYSNTRPVTGQWYITRALK
jgi:hypothetical protein